LEKEKILQNEIIAHKEQKNIRQRLIIYISVIGLIVFFFLSILILRLFIHKRKANRIITERNEALQTAIEEINAQKEEISAQRDEIESQRDLVVEQKDKIEIINKEMTDSIYYAKRIQSAMLLSQENRSALLGNHFVFFLPRDIVSGDFYWATQINNWLIITVADCTGHGVPGAFMSMLGISFLNEIVRKKEVTNAAQVLNELRDAVIDALKQADDHRELREWLAKTSSVKDGMDVSLIAIDKNTGRCQWAGANSSLYIVREQTLPPISVLYGPDFSDKNVASIEYQGYVLYEIKGDNMPVAIHLKMDHFTNHEFQLIGNDRIYLFTDGFPDQFGGPKGKKFLYSKFKALILETSLLNIPEQGKQIKSVYQEWLGSNSDDHNKQTDDITVVGIKI
ncbi:MAG: SpoIIE family protein phosphatase, partial [Bacteroidota bacterium]